MIPEVDVLADAQVKGNVADSVQDDSSEECGIPQKWKTRTDIILCALGPRSRGLQARIAMGAASWALDYDLEA
jgi:hypothetical protein